jgi:hypothetical protein
MPRCYIPPPRAFSSVGRAPARQAGGHWFEPSNAHAPDLALSCRLRFIRSGDSKLLLRVNGLDPIRQMAIGWCAQARPGTIKVRRPFEAARKAPHVCERDVVDRSVPRVGRRHRTRRIHRRQEQRRLEPTQEELGVREQDQGRVDHHREAQQAVTATTAQRPSWRPASADTRPPAWSRSRPARPPTSSPSARSRCRAPIAAQLSAHEHRTQAGRIVRELRDRSPRSPAMPRRSGERRRPSRRRRLRLLGERDQRSLNCAEHR